MPRSRHRIQRHLPIHERTTAVNPQASSPLYNGLIPPEIRNALFAAILAEYFPPDLAYPPSVRRPDYPGPPTINIAFLRTCRRVYLETYHLPPLLASHVFWHAPWSGPPGLTVQFPDPHGHPHEEHYFNVRLTSWQRTLVREVHLFTQMFWLDQSFAELAASEVLPEGVERLKITIRRGDWWYNELKDPFTINPHRGGMLEEYLEDVERAESGEEIPWEEDGWGGALQHLPALKELEMEFETTVDRKDELKIIVERALRWRFPMGDRGVLSNEGLGMEMSEWQSEADEWLESEDETQNENITLQGEEDEPQNAEAESQAEEDSQNEDDESQEEEQEEADEGDHDDEEESEGEEEESEGGDEESQSAGAESESFCVFTVKWKLTKDDN